MKNIKLSILVYACIGSVAFAGGNVSAPTTEEKALPVSLVEENHHYYAGIALSAVSTRESDATLSFTSIKSGQDRLGNATLLVGYNVNTYAAIEARYTTTFVKENISKMDAISIFVKPKYDINDKWSAYGLLGYGQVNIESTESKANVKVDKGGFQWGIGVNYDASEDVSLFVDYTSLASNMDGKFLHSDTVDADALTIGIAYKF